MSLIRPAERECIRIVAALLGSSSDAVCGKSRRPEVVKARWACMVALHRRGLTLKPIAKAMGGKHHTTVMDALDIAEVRYASDIAWQLAVEEGVHHDAPAPDAVRRKPLVDTSDPREACIGLLSIAGRVPPEACRAALVLLSLAAGLPVPPAPPAATVAC